MRTLFQFLAILFLAAIFTQAQDRPTITAQANTVFAGGDGKFDAAPDTAVLQFNISSQESTSRAAYDKVSKSAEQVRQILRNNAIDPKVAEIGYYSVQPQYDYKDPKHKLIGYRVTTSVTLKLKDFTKLPPVLQQLSETDITESQSMSYTLEDNQNAKSKAVEDAFRRARESASAVARAAGRTLGDLSYASVDTSENMGGPIPMMRTMAMKTMNAPAPVEEFTPQNVTINTHVNALFVLK